MRLSGKVEGHVGIDFDQSFFDSVAEAIINAVAKRLADELRGEADAMIGNRLQRREKETSEPQMLTQAGAATYLQVDLRTILRLRKNGDIPYYTVGGAIRIKRSDLEQFLRARRLLEKAPR